MKHSEVVDASVDACLLRATEYLSENSLLYRIKRNSLIVTLEEDVDFDMSSFNIAAGEGKYTMKRMYRSAEKFTMDFAPHSRGCEVAAVYESPRAREIFVAIAGYLKKAPSTQPVSKPEPVAVQPKPAHAQRGIPMPGEKSASAVPMASSGKLVEEGIEALRGQVDLELPLTFKEGFALANSLLSGKYNADIRLDWGQFKTAYQDAVNRWAIEEEEGEKEEKERLAKLLPRGATHCPECGTLLRRTTVFDVEIQSVRDGYRCMKCKKDFFRGK